MKVKSALRHGYLSLLAEPFVARMLKSMMGVALDHHKNSNVAFITPPSKSQGWILDAFCHEIGSRLTEYSVQYIPYGDRFSIAQKYFFSHYMYYVGSYSIGRSESDSYVFATHLEPEKHGIGDRLLAKLLSRATLIFCMNSLLKQKFIELGVPEGKLKVTVGAADDGFFSSHERSPQGKVGFCSAFYDRKSPDLIVDIVRRLPQRRFVLLGRKWQEYRRFSELQSLQNLEYVETAYENYPKHYAEMSVFVSPSHLEGGPIPLLEAMMSNVAPVASRTGFAPDVIKHGQNGFLFDVGSSVEHICLLIERAFQLDLDIRSTVLDYNWKGFVAKIAGHMKLQAKTPDGE